jgi:hypothetical protein
MNPLCTPDLVTTLLISVGSNDVDPEMASAKYIVGKIPHAAHISSTRSFPKGP